MDNSKEEILGRESTSEPDGRNELYLHHENISHDQLRSRLQHLKLELSSVLRSVRYNADETASQKVVTGFYTLLFMVLCNYVVIILLKLEK